MIRRALISVSDKTGLVSFAQFLVGRGVELLSTGGTAALLTAHGIPVRDVSEVTGFPEMMDGRVKTLHPMVHGGLLARPTPEHVAAAAQHGIGLIDLLVVNLYPFESTLNQTSDYDELVENIDIGGPAMIRGAAKNHERVTVIVEPSDYATVQSLMEMHGGAVPLEQRRRFAAKAYARTAAYDTLIASWLSGTDNAWPAFLLDAELAQPLRYGENPHQQAALYQRLDAKGGIANASVLQGKELSYNNLADADAAFAISSQFSDPAAVLIKHANPCGTAIGTDIINAFKKALASDPVSAFGGILSVNRPVDAALVDAIGGLFLEVIIAPEFTPDAREKLAAKKNLRLLIAIPETHASPLSGWMIQAIGGGYLVQQQDYCHPERSERSHLRQKSDSSPLAQDDKTSWKQVSGAPVSAALHADAALAWAVVKSVKSNAIVLVKNGATIGIGAGQMSRVDSVRIAIDKARSHGHDPRGATLASDAFLPFADNVELAAEAGIALLIQPGGSVRDPEVIAAAEKHNIAMLFTGIRHFRH